MEASSRTRQTPDLARVAAPTRTRPSSSARSSSSSSSARSSRSNSRRAASASPTGPSSASCTSSCWRCSIDTLGRRSGAHFNPAVTVDAGGAAQDRRRSTRRSTSSLQLVGAIAGALLVEAAARERGRRVGYGAPTISEQCLEGKAAGRLPRRADRDVRADVGDHGRRGQPAGARDWARPRHRRHAGLRGHASSARSTGAGLNPARAFGPSLVGGERAVGDFIVAYVARADRRRAARRDALHGARSCARRAGAGRAGRSTR